MTHEHIGSTAELDRVMIYLGVLRQHMRLDNWDIFIMLDPPDDEDAHADIDPNDNHYSARLRLQKDWEHGMTADQKCLTLVHELIHLTQRPLNDIWWLCVMRNSQVSQSDAQTWNYDFTVQMERMTSALTRVIADGAPSWPPAKGAVLAPGIYLQQEI